MRSVIVMPRARRQFERAEKWWLSHRDKAPQALNDDFVAAASAIAESPLIYPYFDAKRGIRQMRLERVRYYIYYRINANSDIEIVALWHASRRPPRL